jgi:adenine-specific DNA-methyltransferase
VTTFPKDKAKIEASIKAFRSGALAENAVNFFDALGYRSDRTQELEPSTVEGLLEMVNRDDFFNPVKARPLEWASVDLLFQLTDEEVRDYGQTALAFDSKGLDIVSDRRFESYLFFAIRLKRDSYTRTALADITREVNRFFDMPALVLFKHGETLTLSVINRRLHKRDAGRDVLEKVTLIKDIRVENPHRAHTEILFDLAFPQLAARHTIKSFVELHDAWRQTLDISELNKRFYKDLANWYFWALEQVKFPAQPGVTGEVNRATNVIRLITRLTFVWFLKERQLVPEDLFRREDLSDVLTDLSPTSSTFYKAILQNLFFATLNTPMQDPANPREFRKETEDGKRFNNQYMVHNQYRHKKLFRNPDAALEMFASIPFLNGGLFECLDKPEDVNGKAVEIRVDGFSDIERKQPTVPNRLFFCEEHNCADDGVDLNLVYGTRSKTYRVRGLIDTLDRYKFTIAESTPIEEEVALDPELLGKVFENLLASYNPETGATARKQTGSFYTPREIVNYMVDESLIAYLETRLTSQVSKRQPQSTVMRETVMRGPDDDSLNHRLRQLFAYTDEPHKFTGAEVEMLIKAIDEVKILDPACGSGAYPMGILGKLVFILDKLDPQNAKWKEAQLRRVAEDELKASELYDEAARESALAELQRRREDIEEAFTRNELDYGRKLFLIENCIYGVDIQPIAIQISKLRFFISLIIDQTIRREAENLGVRPLPNLETKFVAANTLLGIEKPAQSMLQNEELRRAIEEHERELKIVRERHFTARTTRAKEKYRKDDERLRHQIGNLLKDDNWSPETTAKLVRWNPYDQNASADFFDPEWMFGVIDGFDIVLGNPPYGYLFKEKAIFNLMLKTYATAEYKIDAYTLFSEKGHQLLSRKGTLCLIIPYTFLSGNYFSRFRKFLNEQNLRRLIVLGKKVFQAADVDTCIFMLNKSTQTNLVEVADYRTYGNFEFFKDDKISCIAHGLLFNSYQESILVADEKSIHLYLKMKKNRKVLKDVLTFYHGIQSRGDDKAITLKKSANAYPLLKGRDFFKYKLQPENKFFVYQPENIKSGGNLDFHLAKKKILIRTTADSIVATIDYFQHLVLNSVNIAVSQTDDMSLEYILGLINSKLIDFWYQLSVQEPNKTFAEVKIVYLERIPIPTATQSQQDLVVKLVNQILAAKRKDMSADTRELEREIDQLVYQLYDLTPGEIEIVEASARR